VTLRDLLGFVCQQEQVPSFPDLRLGPPLRHPLLRQLFSPPLDLAEVPAIGAAQVLEALRAVLLQNLNVRLLGEEQLRVSGRALWRARALPGLAWSVRGARRAARGAGRCPVARLAAPTARPAPRPPPPAPASGAHAGGARAAARAAQPGARLRAAARALRQRAAPAAAVVPGGGGDRARAGAAAPAAAAARRAAARRGG
jgi:hypothetical protein